jgi:hypothetical protein
VQVPGTYSITVTHPAAFRKYLLEQLHPLMNDFTVRVEVGVSQQNIPYPYVVEQGDELAGSGVTAAELARVFPSTDLSAATDGTADGLYDWESTDPLPLALFDAARVDFSLRRPLGALSPGVATEWAAVGKVGTAVRCGRPLCQYRPCRHVYCFGSAVGETAVHLAYARFLAIGEQARQHPNRYSTQTVALPRGCTSHYQLSSRSRSSTMS